MSEHSRKYDLNQIYGEESPLRRYIRLTVGKNAGALDLIWHEFILSTCTWVPGLPGIAIRRVVYPLTLRGFGRRSFIGKHVTLRCPRQVALGNDVIIDEFVQLIATSQHDNAIAIGDGSFIRSFAMVNAGPPDGYVRIGSNCSIGQGTILYGNGGLTIGNNVMIAGQCFIVASSHEFGDSSRPMNQQGFSAKGISISDNVWIGAGAKILDGITVGAGAIIGANAVVNRSVAAGTKVGGIPAREI